MSLSRRVLISIVALAFTLVAAPTAAKTAAAQNRVTAGAIMSRRAPALLRRRGPSRSDGQHDLTSARRG